MKKRNSKTIRLNKISISNLKKSEVKGGISGVSCAFTDCVIAETLKCAPATNTPFCLSLVCN